MMKRYLIYMGIMLTIASCQDPYETSAPDFSVWTEKAVYAVGDTVRFKIAGSPDMINFYSGIFGNEYRENPRDPLYNFTPILSFRSAKYAGNNEDCAELLYTTEFNENYDFNNVKLVNWINISDHFTIPPIVGTSATFSNSGAVDISDLFEEGKPIYFAWHCKTNEASQRTRFAIGDFTFSGVDVNNPSVSSVIYSQPAFGFQWSLNPDAAGQESNLPSVTNTLITWDGIFNNLAGPLKEGYAISGPVMLPDAIVLQPDLPIVVKSIQTENLTEFLYVFEEAGEFEVAFVGYNINFSDRSEAVKKMKITIQE